MMGRGRSRSSGGGSPGGSEGEGLQRDAAGHDLHPGVQGLEAAGEQGAVGEHHVAAADHLSLHLLGARAVAGQLTEIGAAVVDHLVPAIAEGVDDVEGGVGGQERPDLDAPQAAIACRLHHPGNEQAAVGGPLPGGAERGQHQRRAQPDVGGDLRLAGAHGAAPAGQAGDHAAGVGQARGADAGVLDVQDLAAGAAQADGDLLGALPQGAPVDAGEDDDVGGWQRTALTLTSPAFGGRGQTFGGDSGRGREAGRCYVSRSLGGLAMGVSTGGLAIFWARRSRSQGTP